MSSNNITIGIDLGDRRHAVCILSAAGDILAAGYKDDMGRTGEARSARLSAL